MRLNLLKMSYPEARPNGGRVRRARKPWHRHGRKLFSSGVAGALVVGIFLPFFHASATTCATSGSNVTISSNCIFDAGTYTFTGTLTINSGVTVTAASNVGGGQVIIVSDNIDVQGTIDGNALGFAAGTGTGEPPGSYAGAGHGGDGGDYASNAGGVTYGSVTSPSTLGSGASEGFAGGAAIKLSAPSGTITIGGVVRANGGGGAAAGGAGGSVWIDADTLAGAGSVTANGGANTGSGYGGGGGGRIAIYYNTDSSTVTKTAFGGGATGAGQQGGAGSIYTDDKDDLATNGNLVIDNNNGGQIGASSETTQVTTASQTYDDITVKNGAKYVIPNTMTLTVASGGTFTTSGSTRPKLTVNSGGTFNPPSATFTFSGIDVTNDGTVGVVTNLSLANSIFTNNGSLSATVTDLTFNAGASTFVQNGTGFADTDVVVDDSGTFVAQGTFSANSLTVQNTGTFEQRKLGAISVTTVTVNSGGTLTHTANTTSKAYELYLSSTTIDIQAGGTASVANKGFQAGSGTGTNPGSYAGAGHGGDGGDYSSNAGGPTYGDPKSPTTLGSGASGGGAGGGALYFIVSGTLTVNGSVTAAGQNNATGSGGGAGGSVWIDADTLAGAGSVSGNGGSNTSGSAGGGGGGRVAIYFNTDSSTVTKTAYGGGSTGAGQAGGAGTVFTDDKDDAFANGDLVVDNNNGATIGATSETTQVTTASQTYDSVTIKNGAKYVIPNTMTLTVASGGTFTGGGSTRPKLTVNTGGTFNPPAAAFAVSGIDITNGGTVGVATSLSLANTIFTHNGTFSATVTGVTFNAGASTFIHNGTGFGGADIVVDDSGTFIAQTSLSITSLTVMNTGTFEQRYLGALSIGTVTVQSGGTVTHTTNTTSKLYEINFSSTTIDVQTGGTVSANGKGFSAGQGTGVGVGSYTGGGHGGRGGYYNANVGGVTYGSVTQPTTLGSGGYSSGALSGGGAVKLVASGTLTVAGTVSANGTGGGQAGGAGGSVWLDAATLAGAGTVSANGGANSGNDYAGGGGGRVAVYYNTDSSTVTKTAYGGLGTFNGKTGGAGTVYVDDKDDSLTNNTLVVDNNNQANIVSNSTTDQVTTASQTYDAVTVKNGAIYLIPNTMTLTIPSSGTLTTSGTIQPALTISSGGTFNPPTTGTYTFTSLDVTLSGTLNTITNLTLNDSTFIHSGTFGATLTDVTCQSACTFIPTTTSTFAPTNFTVQSGGTFEQRMIGAVSITTVTVNSGGNLTHTANTTSKLYELSLSSTTIDVQTGGTVNVNGKGFQAGSGTGVNPASYAGAGHGGDGGDYSTNAGGPTYGDPKSPTTLGSGASGGNAGGGAVKLVASGTLTVNGSITSTSATATINTGSGGSIWLDAGTLAGAGSVSASAGNNTSGGYGAGGGGRVAIYYNTDSSTVTKTAYGGAATGAGQAGGAGTIFTDDKDDAFPNGDLVVDNNNGATIGATSETTQVATASQTYDNVTIKNGSKYKIPNTMTLAVASGGTLTGGGATMPSLTVNSGGTFNPPSATFTFSSIDVTNSGTVGIVTSLTLTNSTFTHSGNLSATVTSLTLQSGGTFAPTVTTGLSLSTVTVQSGGTFEQRMLGAISVTTVTVNSGGNLTHTANTSSKLYELNLSSTTVDVQSGGTVNVNSKGFSGGNGTGVGGTPSGYGAGGGHGGAGGNAFPGSGGGVTYGLNTDPTTLGSGGGNGSGTGGSGGGVVKIVATGTVTVAGSITSNGGTATGYAGGGAGGSIRIDAAVLAGSGTVTANGGNGGPSGGSGGGGGGRIAWYYGSKTLSATCTVNGGLKVAGGSATDGAAGTCYEEATGGPPAISSVTHTPSGSPLTTQSVTLFGTATDDTGVTKIEIYLDGTAPANLKHTCNFSPAQTPASCQISVGLLSAGSHTTTVRAYDATPSSTDGTEVFSVTGQTTGGVLTLGRSKVSVSTSFQLAFVLSGSSTGALTVTFPGAFTVTAAGNGGASSACLSSFGFTSTTLTATKTGCSGTVTLGGATVTNPSSPGEYVITWTNDNGSASVIITSEDQIGVNAAVDPVLTMNVGSQSSATACDGTFSGNGGTVALGALTAGAVTSSDAASVAHLCSRVTTNAMSGAVMTVRSLNGALASASVPADTIPSVTGTLSAGTANYGLCAGSAGGDSGRDSTTPAGATPARTAPFDGASCTSAGHDAGGLTTSAQSVWSLSGPSQNAFFRLFLKAAISATTFAHNDYADTLTFVVTGTY